MSKLHIGAGVTLEMKADPAYDSEIVTFTVSVSHEQLARVGGDNVVAFAVARIINALELDKPDAVSVVRRLQSADATIARRPKWRCGQRKVVGLPGRDVQCVRELNHDGEHDYTGATHPMDDP